MSEAHAEHFQDLAQQAQAARLGTWLFLASEVLFFAGLFAIYTGYRAQWPDAFHLAARETDRALGTANTAVLLTSSWLVALAVHAAREGRSRRVVGLTSLTIALGAVFLALKGLEYRDHLAHGLVPGGRPADRGQAAFWTLYWAMTGLHALHVVVGMGTLAVLAALVGRGRLGPERAYVFENGANFWHLVDVIWLFLWPLLYLTRGGQ